MAINPKVGRFDGISEGLHHEESWLDGAFPVKYWLGKSSGASSLAPSTMHKQGNEIRYDQTTRLKPWAARIITILASLTEA